MKILKSILIALSIIAVIIAVGIYFLPNHMQVTSTIEIDKPARLVYSQVSDFNNWVRWDPWKEMDPDSKGVVEGAPGAIGHKLSWKGEKSGEGDMTIEHAVTNSSLNIRLNFAPMIVENPLTRWELEETNGITKVSWTTKMGLKYPAGRLAGLAMEKLQSEMQEKGLKKLKTVCEAMPTPPPPVAVADTLEDLEEFEE